MPEPGCVELRLPRVRDQTGGRGRPAAARRRLRKLRPVCGLLPGGGADGQDEPGHGPRQPGREGAHHLLLLRRGLQFRSQRARRQGRPRDQRRGCAGEWHGPVRQRPLRLRLCASSRAAHTARWCGPSGWMPEPGDGAWPVASGAWPDQATQAAGRRAWDSNGQSESTNLPIHQSPNDQLHRRPTGTPPSTWSPANSRRRKQAHGGDAFAVLASAKCTNEENFLFAKFTRQMLATQQHRPLRPLVTLQHRHRSGDSIRQRGDDQLDPRHRRRQPSASSSSARTPPNNHPVIGTKIRRAKRQRGAKLIVADPRRIDIADYADLHLRHKPGTDIALLNGLMHVILREGWEDDDFIAERTEGFEEFKAIGGQIHARSRQRDHRRARRADRAGRPHDGREPARRAALRHGHHPAHRGRAPMS